MFFTYDLSKMHIEYIAFFNVSTIVIKIMLINFITHINVGNVISFLLFDIFYMVLL